MAVVVDAQILKGHFQESVLGIDHDLTGSPNPIFDHTFRIDALHVDAGGQVAQEWRSVVEPEWFDAWYVDQVRDGFICEIDAKAEKQLKKDLSNLGFPATGRDIWYARLCNSAAEAKGFCFFVSEDLDFYQPGAKGGDAKRRQKILREELGAVRKYLKKERSIHVKPVVNFVSDFPSMREAAVSH